jgi:hypothetical protein
LTKNQSQDKLLVIQWSTWEREEWLYDKIYYQVNGSGIDQVPAEAAERYRDYIIGLDWNQKTIDAHNAIWQFHRELESQDIAHIFFNGNNDFSIIGDEKKKDWGNNYIGPYDPTSTFDSVIRAHKYSTVTPNSWHFGKDAHSFFHRFMLQYIIDNKFI